MHKNIILIEDVSLIRSRLKQTLKENGFDVHEISGGRKVLKNKKLDPLQKEPGILDMVNPDIFILSIDLRDYDGLKILKIIKSHDEYKKIPVIVSSNHNDKDTIIAAISSGAADYVLKNKSFVNTLLNKVTKIYESSKATFKNTLKREVDWIRYGNKELSFAMIMVRRYNTNKAIDKDSFGKVVATLKSKMRHYDWAFPISDKRVAVILPITTLNDVVMLRNRLLELLKMLGDEIKLPMDIQIGFSHYPVNAKSPEELIFLAEEQIQE